MLHAKWTTLKPHREQTRMMHSNARRIACRAARRSGKTTIAKRKLVMRTLAKTWHGLPARCLYLAPVRQQAKDVAWQDLKDLMPSQLIAGEPSETELKIKTIFGGELVVGGFDVPQRFEGVPWDFIVVDESADIKPDKVNTSLIPALADRKGDIWRIGVPKRVGPGAKEFNSICDDRSKGYEYYTWTAAEILADDELEYLRQHLPSKDFAEQILGQVVTASGLAFYEFDARLNVENTDATRYNPNRTLVVGSDFNVDPMAWVIAHCFNGQVYVIDEIWLRNTNTRSALNELMRRYPDHKAGWEFLGDATGRARKTVGTSASQSDYLIIKNDERLNRGNGVVVKYPRANPAVKDRLASTNAMLCNSAGRRRIHINPSCTHLIDDLGSRGVDESGQPVDANKDSGHITDAFGYLIHGKYPVSRIDFDWDDSKPDERAGKRLIEFFNVISSDD